MTGIGDLIRRIKKPVPPPLRVGTSPEGLSDDQLKRAAEGNDTTAVIANNELESRQTPPVEGYGLKK